MNLSLADALRAKSSSSIAFIGAGGKSTAIFQLAKQLPAPVIVTATSHLGAWQIELADQHIITETPAPLEALEHGLQGVILVTGKLSGDRTEPVNDHLLDWLREFCGYHDIPLLIEADGARGKPVKGWADHEPPIPSFVDQVVQVIGLTALGKPLNEESVHRSEIFSRISGLRSGESITPGAMIRVLTHAGGGLKNIPATARRVVLLNQAETPGLQGFARGMVQSLLSSYHSVVISSLKEERIFAVHEPVAGIILAAGESSRFGRPKQLLDWHGQPFVRAVARTALEASLSPVIVVTGANAEGVESAVVDLDVKVVRNPEWKSGQGSSIKAGIQSLTHPPPRLPQIRKEELSYQFKKSGFEFGGGAPAGAEGARVGAAIFLLVDQPQMTASIIRALVEKHAEGLYSIVAPMVIDRRANPVLFDRVTFPDLMTLEGDVGGRAVFHKHRVEYLPWHDDRLLLDVDTPEMYQRLISDEEL